MNEPRPLLGARELRARLESHGVRPRKGLGQNFVVDPNTIRKVVEIAELDDRGTVLEIGAGVGSLTIGLAAAAERVVAVEFDRRLIPLLEEVLSGVTNVEVVAADAMSLDYSEIDASSLAGNLPYNLATGIVLKVLEEAPQIVELTVMTQREVGERLAASPGSKPYGHVSVMVRYFADARVAARVSRRAFYPVPGVDSVVVRIVRRSEPNDDHRHLFAVTRAAFAQRRKVLRNSLAGIAGSSEAAEAACERAGVDPRARPETVDLAGFIALARELSR